MLQELWWYLVMRHLVNYSVWNSELSAGKLFFAFNRKRAVVRGERIALARVKDGDDTFREPFIVKGVGPWVHW